MNNWVENISVWLSVDTDSPLTVIPCGKLASPMVIGEHPDIVSAVNIEICKLSEADDKLHTLNKYYLKKN